MNEEKSFYKNNILEIVFLLGIIGIYALYWLCMTNTSVSQAKFLYSASVFIGEFVWLLVVCYFAKTLDTFAKLVPLNLLAVICLVVICSYLSYTYIPHCEIVIFIVLVGLVSFLFSIIVFAAAIKAKGLREDNKD